MSPFLPSTTEFLRSFQPVVIHIWEVRILINVLWTISSNLSRKNLTKISVVTREHSKKLNVRSKKASAHSHQLMKLKSKLKTLLRVTTLMNLSQEPDLRNSMLISSKKLLDPSRPHLMTPTCKKIKLMKSYSSEVLLEFPKLDNSSRTSSMEKNPTPVLTQMRLSLTVLPYRVVFCVVRKVKKLRV